MKNNLEAMATEILVIDDEIGSRRLLTEILSKEGYRVRPAEGPQVALESALAHPPGLILLDVRMPEMSGYELCRQFKQDERTRDIPVIFVSALQDVADRVQGFKVGGVDFVSKPFEETEVLARVKTHLQLHTMRLHLEELVSERTVELRKTNVALQLEVEERKQAQETLRESEARFRATFEQAAVGIAHVAPDGRFLRLNQRFCDIVGYSQEEMLTLTFQDITHLDDLDEDLELLRQLLQGEAKIYSFEKRYFRKNREIVWVNLTVSLLWEETGSPGYFISVIEDITRQKQLQEERDRILDLSQDLICIAGMDGYLKYVSPAWERTMGYTQEELLSRPFLDFIHPDDHGRNDAEVEALAAGNDTIDFENRYICKDGSVLTISWTATPLLEDRVMYCIGRDITNRKQAERALRESEEKLRAVIDQSPVSIQIHGLDGKLLQSNPAYAKLYALNDETLKELYEKYNVRADAQAEALGVTPYIERVYLGEEVLFPPYEYNGIDTLKTLDFENPVSRKCWIRTLGFPLKDEWGNITSVVFMSEDFTHRKQAEQELQEYQGRLKALASELTLAEERERRRIAADLHDHVSQSLALARIQLGKARSISTESRRNELIDDALQTLMEASQDTRSLIFELSSPLLNELGLETAVSAWLRDQIGTAYNIETEFFKDDQEKPLTEDMEAVLFRSVRELLANVVRHAQATAIQVSLARQGSEIKITIQDDGLGFDPRSVLHQIHPRGGFGLFSIQERMADLGGSFEISSTPGKGCTAVLTAPLDIE